MFTFLNGVSFLSENTVSPIEIIKILPSATRKGIKAGSNFRLELVPQDINFKTPF